MLWVHMCKVYNSKHLSSQHYKYAAASAANAANTFAATADSAAATIVATAIAITAATAAFATALDPGRQLSAPRGWPTQGRLDGPVYGAAG